MMKYAGLLMVVLLATCAFAEAEEFTLFSFEDQLPGFDMVAMDGYLFLSAGDPEYGQSVTDGNYSMAIDLPDGWTQGLQGGVGLGWDWHPYFPELSEAWRHGGKLLIDVTTSSAMSNVPLTGAVQLAVFIQGQSNADPGQFGYTLGYRNIEAVHYVPGPGDPPYITETLEWDLGVDMNGNPTWFPSIWTEEDGGWADLRIHTNVIGATNVGIIIIDNIRVVIFDGESRCSIGDFNQDGIVDIADYTVWADRFGMTGPPHVHGDANGDNVVDIADYTIWADHFGATGSAAQ